MLSGLRRFLSLRRRDRLDAELREERGGASIDMLVQDVRYGVRMMRKAPGFSAVAIASLALGIAASTVTFSVMNGVVFRPIAADRPEQLIRVFTGVDGSRYSSSSYAEYESLRGLSIFGGLLASARAAATVSEGDRAEVIHGVLVSENYFDVLGLRPEDQDRVGGLRAIRLPHHRRERGGGGLPLQGHAGDPHPAGGVGRLAERCPVGRRPTPATTASPRGASGRRARREGRLG